MNYYNEFDPFAASWLRALIEKGLIPAGDVDERSITEVKADDLKGYTQCHFFAGIGGWSYALHLAEWDASRPVWTGSCPCQPFSSAGNRKGKGDERHLWPVWFNLVRECRPPVVFGEQVSSAIAHGWLDDVYQGLEGEGYACGSAVLPACSVGAPHRRDRLWFVADHQSDRWNQGQSERSGGNERISEGRSARLTYDGSSGNGSLGQPDCTGSQPREQTAEADRHGGSALAASGDVADAELCRREREQIIGCGELQLQVDGERKAQQSVGAHGSVYASSGHVADAERPQTHQEQKRPAENERGWVSDVPCRRGVDNWKNGIWLDCPDGKQRLVEPGIPLLAYGVPNRVGKLRGYGNAIVPQVAAEFVMAYMETTMELLE